MPDAIEEFVTGTRPPPNPDLFLGSVLLIDVAGATQLAAEASDRRFQELLDSFLQLVQRPLERYQGKLLDTADDGALAWGPLYGSWPAATLTAVTAPEL